MHKLLHDMKNMLFSAVVLGISIYVLMDDKSVYRLKYHDENASWEKMADMKKKHGPWPPAAELSGILYVIGGSNKCSTKSVELYIPSVNQWIELRDKSWSSQSSAIVSSRGYIYSFGGYSPTGYMKKVERFDPTSSTWAELSPMIEAKGFETAVELDGLIYVLGGAYGAGDREKFASMHCYHLENNAWTTLESMPTSRWWFRAFVVDGSIHAVGGFGASNSIDKYDVGTNEWTAVEIPEKLNLDIMESVKIEVPM